MKKLLITAAATLLTVAVFAQGTVFFSNGALNKISTGAYNSAASTWAAVPTTMGGQLNFGLFYGTGATAPATLTFLGSVSGVSSSANAGIINLNGSPVTAVSIPGSPAGSQNVWIQIAGWSSSFGTDWAAARAASLTTQGDFFGQTAAVVNVANGAGGLGPSTGPGALIWQSASLSDPTKFAGGFAVFTTVPEPSTMALAGLGMAALLIFRRRK